MVAVKLPLLVLVTLVTLWTPGEGIVYEDTLDVCFFCDLVCTNILNHYYGENGVDSYLDSVMNDTVTLMKTLGPSIDSRKLMVVKMAADLELAWFNGNDQSADALATANMGLWGDLTGMYKDARESGCDVGFALFTTDNAFLYAGIEGIANTFKACTDLSFSIIKLYPTDLPHQVALLAHEIGHIVGLYHDGPMNDNYQALRSFYPDDVNTLDNVCGSQGSGCEDPSGYCIMSPISGAGGSYATEFSQCSIVYFRLFLMLSHDFPMIYDTSCFVGDRNN